MQLLLLAAALCLAGLQQVDRAKAPVHTQQQPAPPNVSELAESPARVEVRADSLHIALLERVNSQLSLVWNPLGVMIGALGVLFAVGAIASGLILYRQGREYRSLLEKAIAENGRVVTAYLEEKGAHFEAMRQALDEHLARSRSELAQLSGEQKTQMQQYVDRLEALQRNLRRPPEKIILAGATSPGILTTEITGVTCQNCGQWAIATDTDSRCVHCGQYVPRH
jgi:hypothetical protein